MLTLMLSRTQGGGSYWVLRPRAPPPEPPACWSPAELGSPGAGPVVLTVGTGAVMEGGACQLSPMGKFPSQLQEARDGGAGVHPRGSVHSRAGEPGPGCTFLPAAQVLNP